MLIVPSAHRPYGIPRIRTAVSARQRLVGGSARAARLYYKICVGYAVVVPNHTAPAFRQFPGSLALLLLLLLLLLSRL